MKHAADRDCKDAVLRSQVWDVWGRSKSRDDPFNQTAAAETGRLLRHKTQ